jgi:hypothetical protein
MTVEPVTYELIIPQRASLAEGPIWLPFDGTGASILASVWTSNRRTTKLFDLQVEVLADRVVGEDPADPGSVECKIALGASWTTTRTVKRNGYWDLLVIWPDATRDYFMEGPAIVNLNVTEEGQ